LLHEHHDFFLASQHPSASQGLQKLAAKLNMPARMWRNGIHSFLEILRHQLPHSLEYMIAFIYLGYQMMSLLFESVPYFEDTWIECLGDLSRYRMAVEEHIPDREIWASMARFWYSKVSDRLPSVGRLYHHLAILARPNAMEQLYLYCRALISRQSFISARESVQTLLDLVLKGQNPQFSRNDLNFIKIHALLFYGRMEEAEEPINTYNKNLIGFIDKHTATFREIGVFTAVIDIASMFNYGQSDQPLRRLFDLGNFSLQQTDPTAEVTEHISHLKQLSRPNDTKAAEIFKICCKRNYTILKKVFILPFVLSILEEEHFLTFLSGFLLGITKRQRPQYAHLRPHSACVLEDTYIFSID
jgi:hypothetical protein